MQTSPALGTAQTGPASATPVHPPSYLSTLSLLFYFLQRWRLNSSAATFFLRQIPLDPKTILSHLVWNEWAGTASSKSQNSRALLVIPDLTLRKQPLHNDLSLNRKFMWIPLVVPHDLIKKIELCTERFQWTQEEKQHTLQTIEVIDLKIK